MAEQVRTSSISVETIMRHPNFKIGFDDVRAGRPFNCDLDDRHWVYERGRLLGVIAPLAMALTVGGRLNPRAVALFTAAVERRLIP